MNIDIIRQGILETLQDVYPEYVDRDTLKKRTNLDEKELDQHIMYFKEEGAVDTIQTKSSWFKYARITSKGLDALDEVS